MKIAAVLLLATAACFAQGDELQAVLSRSLDFYHDLHQHPELSGHETRTSAALAAKLREAGYDVTEHVGNTGIVAILKNGPGPAVMLRTELDALPVEEKTGLPYASKIRTKNDVGQEVGVMHACGHDIHMASLYGTASIMAAQRNRWHGTLMLIGQPAEETINGASAMLRAGLFTRFQKPDYAIAFHDNNAMPAGKVAVRDGYVLSNADSIRIVMFGKGSHGSMPQNSIDPVLMVARATVALQSIVSREIAPGDPAVVTVGYIHAGTKNNIIPDSAEMGLTVRSYSPETRKHLLDAIQRIVRAEAQAAGAEKEPLIERYEGTASVYNDPKLTARIRNALVRALGAENVIQGQAELASDDFAEFGQAGVPIVMVPFGAADPQAFAESKTSGKPLPSNHSPFFAPDAEPTIRTAIRGETAILQTLLQ